MYAAHMTVERDWHGRTALSGAVGTARHDRAFGIRGITRGRGRAMVCCNQDTSREQASGPPGIDHRNRWIVEVCMFRVAAAAF
jgi:hypothetical protein